jgi:hypothetical protein
MTHCHDNSIGQVKPTVLILPKQSKGEGMLLVSWGFEHMDAISETLAKRRSLRLVTSVS